MQLIVCMLWVQHLVLVNGFRFFAGPMASFGTEEEDRVAYQSSTSKITSIARDLPSNLNVQE